MAAVGSFLANMLAGGLEEGQRRREEGRQLRLAQVSAQIRDPLTFLLLHQLAGGGGTLNLQDPTMRAFLGLGKTTTQITEEEKARKTGELEAEPGLREKQRQDILKTHQELKQNVFNYLSNQRLHEKKSRPLQGLFSAVEPVTDQDVEQYLATHDSDHRPDAAASIPPAPPQTPVSNIISQPRPSEAELVRVFNRTGKPIMIRRSDLPRALKSGYRSR